MAKQAIDIRESYDNVDLSNLTDQQNVWISQMSYLDIDKEGREKLKNGEIKVSELKGYLDNPDTPYFGTAGFKSESFAKLVNRSSDGKSPLAMTNSEVVDELCKQGLGDLRITAVNEEQNFASSGFQALAFKDDCGNTGISYRGSDIDLSRGAARDWIESDLLEYFKSDSSQVHQAKDFFDKNRNIDGNNYLYGHSLGGNLTQHVYAENHDDVKHAFSINGNPINQKLLDTPDKVAAFQDEKKFSCNVVCGDVVGHLKSCDKYQSNVNYIVNSGELKGLSAHFVQSSQYDENGNFVKTTKEEAMKEIAPFAEKVLKFAQDVRENLNRIGEMIDEFKTNVAHMFGDYRKDVLQSIQTVANDISNAEKDLKLNDFEENIDLSNLEGDIDLDELVDGAVKMVELAEYGEITVAAEVVNRIVDKDGLDLSNGFDDAELER